MPPQPKALQDVNDLSYLQTKKHPIGSQLRQENMNVQSDNQRLMDDAKKRQEHVRQLEIESFIKNVPDAKPEEYDFLRMEYMKD